MTNDALTRYQATCGRCGTAFAHTEPFHNVFCPQCPKGGMRGVLNSDPVEPTEADLLISNLRAELEAERAKVLEMRKLLRQLDNDVSNGEGVSLCYWSEDGVRDVVEAHIAAIDAALDEGERA